MSVEENRPRRGWRRVGRGVRKVARALSDALGSLDALVLVVRVVTFPLRVLWRALDALW